MKILKIRGTNEQIILEQIKKEYGESALIINSQEERQQGIFGLFKKNSCVVTVAVKEEVKTNDEIKKDETGYMFLELKAQLEQIKKDINKVSEYSSINTEENSLLQEGSTKGKLVELLQEEGIQKEILSDCLKELEDDKSIKEIVWKLKTELIEYLPMATEKLPQIVFFVGSTGVGKTTTIAKLTAKKMIEEKKKVALFTADTYRIAAIEQLRTYAEILGVPLEVIYQNEDLQEKLEKWKEVDHILIDTAGKSHKNIEQLEEMRSLTASIKNKKMFLVLNMSTPYVDIKNIVDTYQAVVGEFELILTKVDETDELGNLINIAHYTKVPIRYITNGQSVPDDIEIFESSDYINQLLGRINYE